MPVNPAVIGHQAPVVGIGQQNEGQAADRPLANIVYDKVVHGDAETFRRSGDPFTAFKEQYVAELGELGEMVSEKVTGPRGHQLTNQIESYKSHLFDSNDHFSTKSEMMFGSARDAIVLITELVLSDDISDGDKVTSLERATGDMDKCADGVLDNLQSAVRQLQFAKQGAVGVIQLTAIQQIEAEAQVTAQREHGHDPSYAGNEVHIANAYKNHVIEAQFRALPLSKDGVIASTRVSPILLAGFADRVEVSITPGSVADGLGEKIQQQLTDVLDRHGLPTDAGFSPEKFGADVNSDLNAEVVVPLKPFISDHKVNVDIDVIPLRPNVVIDEKTKVVNVSMTNPKESFSIGDLMDTENPDVMSFKGSEQKIRVLLAEGIGDSWGALTGSAANQSPGPMQPIQLTNGVSLHHENGLFSVETGKGAEGRPPRVGDLNASVLRRLPLPLVSDLAQRAIGEATSADELISFVAKLSERAPSSHPLQASTPGLSNALQSRLMQAIRENTATKPELRESIVQKIQGANAQELASVQVLIGESSVLRAAFLNQASEVGMDRLPSAREYLSDLDVVSQVPVKLLLKESGLESLSVLMDRAAQTGHVGAIEKLLAVPGIDVNKPNGDGSVPLHVASYEGHAGVVKQLLGATGIEVNQLNGGGITPLHYASGMGHAGVVEQLVRATGIDVNLTDGDGRTPLDVASSQGHAGVVKQLLAAPGIEVNPADEFGATPLHVASYADHAGVVEQLLGVGGIEVNQTDNEDKTPLDYATTNNHQGVVALLEAHADLQRKMAAAESDE